MLVLQLNRDSVKKSSSQSGLTTSKTVWKYWEILLPLSYEIVTRDLTHRVALQSGKLGAYSQF